MNDLAADVRYAFRMLRVNPGFTAVAILSLAIGVGANTAMFSLADAMLLRPLPVERPQRLIALGSSDSHSVFPHGVSYLDYQDYRQPSDVMSDAMLFAPEPFSLNRNGQSERLWGDIATENYFSMLGVRPAVGRFFQPEDGSAPGADPVVVLSYRYWQRRFAGDSGVIGQAVQINSQPFTVIGVAPREFLGTEIYFAPDIWVPMLMAGPLFPSHPKLLEERDAHDFRCCGRLRDGVSIAQAGAAVATRARQLEQAYPESNKNVKVLVFPEWEARFEAGTGKVLAMASAMLLAVVILVLLIACANVANLMLARATARRREFSIRQVLGAGRGRLIRQLLTESILMAMLGGIAGVVLAVWVTGLLSSFRPATDIPILFDFRTDIRVLVFTFFVAVLTGVIFGLAPALQASKPNLVPSLKGEEYSPRKRLRGWTLRNLLVVGQVSVSLLLLVCAGLFFRSLQNAANTETGFHNRNLLMFSMSLRQQGYDETRGLEFYRQFLEKAAALPGVKGVSLAFPLPLDFFSSFDDVYVEGYQPKKDEGKLSYGYTAVSQGFFVTAGTPLLKGRDFSSRDTKDQPGVVIVNETFARRFWPGQEAIGKRIRVSEESAPYLTVVGLARDAKYRNLSESPQPYLYFPMQQQYPPEASFVAESSGDPLAMVPGIRGVVRELDANVPVYAVKTVADHINGRALLPFRIASGALTIFGGLGLVLAAVGLYGVMSYSVRQRTKEIGIRMAIGAQPRQILKQVVGQGLVLTLLGLGIGLVATLVATRAISSILFGVSAADPATFGAIPFVLLLVALLACYLPARRAMKVDPMEALRHE